VPSVVFTVPELARVGMLTEAAEHTGRNIRVVYNDTGGCYSNLRIGQTCAASKIIIDKDTDEILGAHLLGRDTLN
jgi:glutathione reductase (NADPH)